MDAALDLGKTLDFMRVLWATAHAVEQRSRHMHNVIGLTGPQRLVVRLIGKFPQIAPGTLARTLHLHPSTLTPQLKRLEGDGLIKRTTDVADGRRATFELTKKGRAQDRPNPHTIEAAVSRIIGDHSDKDLATTQRVLLSLVKQLESNRK